MDSRENIDHDEGRFGKGLAALVKSLRWAFGIMLGIIILMLIYFVSFGGYFSVEPQQTVLVLRFGKIVDSLSSGGYWFVPYPVHQFVRIQTNQQFLTVDLTAADDGRAASALTPGRDRYLLTGDANIVHTSWNIGYRVADPVKYYTTLATPSAPVINGRAVADTVETDGDGFTGTRGLQTLLKSLFTQTLLEVTSASKVDEILSVGQSVYNEKVLTRFAAAVRDMDCGIEIVSVTLNRISPPAATKKAFEDVTASGNTRDTLRNEARAYEISVRNDTMAKQAEILADAETYRKKVVAVVRAESTYFDGINKEYQQSPETILMALYTSTLSDALSELDGNKFILGTKGEVRKQLRIRLNPETKKPAPLTEEKK
ncbi:MAG: hypothetical protein MJ033_08230 [Victivallaceae bacterium]|nr:hypothetical protein [Victivallaceae bacterium]